MRLAPLSLVLPLVLAACATPGYQPVSVALTPVEPAPEPPPPPPKPADPHQDPPPKAIAPDLPDRVTATFEPQITCASPVCTDTALFAKGAQHAPTAPVALWTQHFKGKGHTLSTPRDTRIDVYGVVLEGRASVSGVEAPKGEGYGPWQAFRAPGGGLRIKAEEPGTRVLLITAADGDLDAVVAEKASPKHRWQKRASPIERRDLRASPDLAWRGGAMHARLGFEGPGQRISLGTLLGSPDARVAQHTHDDAFEILLAIEADGTFTLENGDAIEPHKLAAGGTAFVPRGKKHAWAPSGQQRLLGLQIYAPAGPEQRFKGLAAAAH